MARPVQPIEQVVTGFKPMVPREDIIANVRSCLARGLPTLQPGRYVDATAIMCGGGPSLTAGIPRILDLQARPNTFTLAVKGAWRALLPAGVRVDFVCMIDPDPSQVDYIDDLPPDIEAIIASCCAPEVFDALRHHRVTTFHIPMGSHTPPDLYPKGSVGAQGGPAVGSRSLRAAYRLGAERLHLFGYDNSFCEAKPGETEPPPVPTHNYILAKGGQTKMRVDCGDKAFWATPVMAGECHDITTWYISGSAPAMTVYGDGMLAYNFHKVRRFADANPEHRSMLGHVYRSGAPDIKEIAA